MSCANFLYFLALFESESLTMTAFDLKEVLKFFLFLGGIAVIGFGLFAMVGLYDKGTHTVKHAAAAGNVVSVQLLSGGASTPGYVTFPRPGVAMPMGGSTPDRSLVVTDSDQYVVLGFFNQTVGNPVEVRTFGGGGKFLCVVNTTTPSKEKDCAEIIREGT
jgi:hypothetical protein